MKTHAKLLFGTVTLTALGFFVMGYLVQVTQQGAVSTMSKAAQSTQLTASDDILSLEQDLATLEKDATLEDEAKLEEE